MASNTVVPEYDIARSDDKEVFHSAIHAGGVLKRIQQFSEFYDVVLVAGNDGKRVSAHRLVLKGSSDYFSTLFAEMRFESEQQEVNLKEIDGGALEGLINFCYTGSVELRQSTIVSLLDASIALQMNEVIAACCKFLESHLNPTNCLDVANLAKKQSFETLLQSSTRFIYDNFMDVSKDPKFLQISAEELTNILSRDDLTVSSEEYIFNIILKWIEYDAKNRQKYFISDLLPLVRLQQLPIKFLVEHIEPLCDAPESKKIFTEALKWHLTIDVSSRAINVDSKPRKYIDQLLLAIFAGQAETLGIQVYCPKRKEWTVWNTPIPISNERFEAVRINDDFALFGTCLVMCLNLRSMNLSHLSLMAKEKRYNSVAVLNGLVYALGGFNQSKAMDIAESWDPSSQTWTQIPSMLQSRFLASATAFRGCLFVTGGVGDLNTTISSVEAYDPKENVWKRKASMKQARHQHGLQVHNGYLYAIGGVVGGFTAVNSIERYDPVTDCWTMVFADALSGGWTKCASLGNDLFILNKSRLLRAILQKKFDSVKFEELPTPPNTINIRAFLAVPNFVPPQGIQEIKNVDMNAKLRFANNPLNQYVNAFVKPSNFPPPSTSKVTNSASTTVFGQAKAAPSLFQNQETNDLFNSATVVPQGSQSLNAGAFGSSHGSRTSCQSSHSPIYGASGATGPTNVMFGGSSNASLSQFGQPASTSQSNETVKQNQFIFGNPSRQIDHKSGSQFDVSTITSTDPSREGKQSNAANETEDQKNTNF